MDASKLRELKLFVQQLEASPALLANPDLRFFRDYLERCVRRPVVALMLFIRFDWNWIGGRLGRGRVGSCCSASDCYVAMSLVMASVKVSLERIDCECFFFIFATIAEVVCRMIY